MPNPVLSILRNWRFRPGLWPTVAAALVVTATILLGSWQARRAEFRGALQTQFAEVQQQPPLQIRRATDIQPQLRYRRAVAEGEYVGDRQIWLDNRTYQGAAGFQIFTPLRLEDGSHLLVSRGWIAATARHSAPPAVPPAGRVSVAGRLNQVPPSFMELQHIAESGPVWQNLDLRELARVSGLTLAPLVLEQAQGNADGLIRDSPAPDSGRDKNVGYMWQWFSLAALAAVLWLILSWQRRDEQGE